MIYFDNNATTAIAAEVYEAMLPYLNSGFGNPSSAYSISDLPRQAIHEARTSIALLLGAADPRSIVFTSGGTESDNWAILGALETAPEKRHVITTSVEHDAVRKVCQKLETRGYRVTWLEVAADGSLDLDGLRSALSKETAVVSAMLANNETGILFPVEKIGEIVKEHSDALFHVDGVNAVGKVTIALSDTEIDLFSVSAHKFHGPKGIGALYIRDGIDLRPMFIGGGQENGRRPGTEAVHQIAGLGAAAKYVSDLEPMERVRSLRDRLEYEILHKIPNCRLNGTSDPGMRLPNTSSLSFEKTNGEMILHKLDAAGIAVSTGSACHAMDHKASHVLEAMNIPYSWAMGSIRFSLGRSNTEAEVAEVVRSVVGIVEELRG